MNLTKIIGVGLISIIFISCIILGGLFTSEMILKYNKLKITGKGINLHQTKYYGKELNRDPYEDFSIQHIHPYYMFSLPWQKKDEIEEKSIVSLNNDGFRNISGDLSKNRQLIFLGGSVAFGHFSTSDLATIGSYLNNLISLDVVNRNAPSWNSHQEAIALFKYDQLDQVSASVSLTLANDISVICRERDINNSREKLDFPESWKALSDKVNDIRKPKESFLKKIKFLARTKIIPNTYPHLHKMKVKIFGNEAISELVIKTDKEQSLKSTFARCNANHIDKVANSFLSNQIRMSKVAESYGFKHFVIIQPSSMLHAEASVEEHMLSEVGFRKSVIKSIIDSQYCLDNPCLDLSTVFDNKGFYLGEYGNIRRNQALREKWFESGIFTDYSHLNDKGNKIIAEHINDFLYSNGIN
jgi:hypothetical protein